MPGATRTDHRFVQTWNGRPIALQKEGASVTLEPGGQFELSGRPVKTLHETCHEVHEHLDQVRAVAETGVNVISIGRLTHSAPALDISMKVG